MKKRYLIITGLILLALGVGMLIHNSMRFQETDDAYIETLPVSIAPKASGHIAKVYVNDNQEVKAGQLIAEIDDADYKVALKSSFAKYDATLNRQKTAKSRLNAAGSSVKLAKTDLDRYKKLFTDGAVSKQELDNMQIKYDNATATMTAATEDVLSSGNDRVADSELAVLAADRDKARLNLSYTKIFAPIDGHITNKSVQTGAFISVGQPICSIVPNEVWVIANFKESQLQNMRVGQSVEIKVDAFPNKKFKGKIDSIQRASGAKSSMFPPENAVGSFVKIVQRIPVKIVFAEPIDASKYTIVSGMSVIPKVRVK